MFKRKWGWSKTCSLSTNHCSRKKNKKEIKEYSIIASQWDLNIKVPNQKIPAMENHVDAAVVILSVLNVLKLQFAKELTNKNLSKIKNYLLISRPWKKQLKIESKNHISPLKFQVARFQILIFAAKAVKLVDLTLTN